MTTPTASKIVNHARAGGGWATDYVRSWRSPGFDRPVSQAATAEQVEHPRFKRWTEAMNHRMMFHRKLWEWCYTLDALDRAGAMRPGAVPSASVWGRRRSPRCWRRPASRCRDGPAGGGRRAVGRDQPARVLARGLGPGGHLPLARRSTGSSRSDRWTCGQSRTTCANSTPSGPPAASNTSAPPRPGSTSCWRRWTACDRAAWRCTRRSSTCTLPTRWSSSARRCSTVARNWPVWPVFCASVATGCSATSGSLLTIRTTAMRTPSRTERCTCE